MMHALLRWSYVIPNHLYLSILAFLMIQALLLFKPVIEAHPVHTHTNIQTSLPTFNQFKLDFQHWKLEQDRQLTEQR